MPITTSCQCGKKFAVKDEFAGQRAKCPACGNILVIPKPDAAAGAKPQPRPQPQASKPAAAPTPPTAPAARKAVYQGKSLTDLFSELTSDDADRRRLAAELLAKVGSEAAGEISLLTARAREAHVLVRHWAVNCLGQLGPAARGCLDVLLNALSDEQPLIREKAAQAVAKIIPAAKQFVPTLLQGLNAKKAEERQAAIDLFRRGLKTCNISRCRYWICTCGGVYEKEDLEQLLRELGGGDAQPKVSGRSCKKCGKTYAWDQVYGGQLDVPQKFWPQLAQRSGRPVQVPEEALAEQKADVGYKVAQSGETVNLASADLLHEISKKMHTIETSADIGEYTLGEVIAHKPPASDVNKVHDSEDEEVDLTPGGTVPETGKYRCTSCGKGRLASRGASTNEAREATVKHFKEGRKFTECPNCEDVTEWELLDED